MAVCNVWIDLQIRPVVGVGRFPLVFVAFELAAVANERGFGRQRQHFGFLADPVVVHALGVFGITHQARHIQATINFKFVANDADHRNPFASPFVLLKDFVAVDLAVPHAGAVGLTAALRFAVNCTQLLVFRRAFKGRHVAGVQIQRRAVVVDVVVIGNTNRVFVQPVADRLIAHAQRLQRRDRRCVWVHAFVLSLGHVFRHKTPLSVRASGVLDGRIHVHAERVTHAANLDVLVKRVVVAILGQQTDVTLAIRHLIFAGRVVRHVGIADVLNVPNHAVEHVGHFHVGVVVHRNDLRARAVLPLVVCHLTHVLRQFVDRQRRARVDRLTLHRATGGQHVRRPLPVVVWRTGIKAQVVHFIFAALSQRRHGQVQP